MSRGQGRWDRRAVLLVAALCALALAVLTAGALAAGGQLDSTFSGDGKRTAKFSAGDAEARGVAVQSNGRIVVAGDSDQGATGTDLAVARFMPNGSFDTSFSGNGKQTASFGGGSTADVGQGLAIQANGRIVVVGSSDQTGLGENFAVARFNPNGSLDQSFSGDGRRSISFGNGTGTDEAEAVAIQPDGRIVVVGDSDQTGTGQGTDFAITRLMPDGSLDTSFSGDGKRTIGFANGTDTDEAEGVAIQGDGRIVVSGASDQGATTENDFAIARFHPNGSLDQSFSGDGKRTVGFGTTSDQGDDVAIQSNGRLVITGSPGFAITRLMPDGNLDQSFSGDGKRVAVFAAFSEGDDLAIQSNGRLVVTGASPDDFAIARFLSNGSLDQSFSGDGKRTVAFTAADDQADDVAIQSNGRIVVAGAADESEDQPGSAFAIARLLAN